MSREKSTSIDPSLTREEVAKQLRKRLKPYDKLNLLEQFAMFMGKAQVLEFGLKSLLVHRCGYDLERMARWTLGGTVRELKTRSLRGDFLTLLEELVGYRNYIAHELLANDAMLRRVLGGDAGRLELKYLERGIYQVEHAILVHDWLEEHDAWGALA
jgi:hypothetical protein